MEQLKGLFNAVIRGAGIYGPTVSPMSHEERPARARPVTREVGRRLRCFPAILPLLIAIPPPPMTKTRRRQDLMGVFETNAVGPLLVAQALAPLLEAQRESDPTRAMLFMRS